MSAAADASAAAGSNVAQAPVPMTADGSALLQHTADDGGGDNSGEKSGSAALPSGMVPASPAEIVSSRQALRVFFDVQATSKFIHVHGARRVALQFPDEWLSRSTEVSYEIKREVGELEKEAAEAAASAVVAEAATSEAAAPAPAVASVPSPSATPAAALPPLSLYILADTSYGSCCVDEVAAQHASADLLVHYGFSCLSSTRRLPVRYVFGRGEVEVEKVCKGLLEDAKWQPIVEDGGWGALPAPAVVPPAEQPPLPLLILYSLEYAHAVSEGVLPRAIQAALAAKGKDTAARKYVVSLATVATESARKAVPAGGFNALATSPAAGSGGCATGSCACKSASSSAAAAPAASCASGACGCSSATQPAHAAGAAPSSTSSLAALSSPSISTDASPLDSTPLLFSSSHGGATPPGELRHFQLNGFRFAFPAAMVATPELFHQVQVVWLGEAAEHRLLTNCMLNYNAHAWHTCHPTSGTLRQHIKGQSRTLARRYYLMEKAKNAGIIGILVGTLGVADYLAVIKVLQKAIKEAGKKSYLFVVGKLNEPKLSNFAEVDLFVLVACALNSMFDSAGLYRDVVTPFELHMALKGEAWKGEYDTSFARLLPPAGSSDAASASSSSAAAAPKHEVREEEWLNDDLASGTRFDPVTGKMRAVLPSHRVAAGMAPVDSDSGSDSALVAQSQGLTRLEGGALVSIPSAADHFLTTRSFQGLQLRHEGEEDQAVAPIEQGLAGIARSYGRTELGPACKQVQQTDAAAQAPASNSAAGEGAPASNAQSNAAASS